MPPPALVAEAQREAVLDALEAAQDAAEARQEAAQDVAEARQEALINAQVIAALQGQQAGQPSTAQIGVPLPAAPVGVPLPATQQAAPVGIPLPAAPVGVPLPATQQAGQPSPAADAFARSKLTRAGMTITAS